MVSAATGGSTGECCAGTKTGGTGGVGGNGGAISFNGSGTINGGTAATSGVLAATDGGRGGSGGYVDTSDYYTTQTGGVGAQGGNGGETTLTWNGAITTSLTGLLATGFGGDGGVGGGTGQDTGTQAGAGAQAGQGGSASVVFTGGTITTTQLQNSSGIAAIGALAEGGAGGAGGRAGGALGSGGGSGGGAGAGGTASVTVVGNIDFTANGMQQTHAVFVSTNGGLGGAGGSQAGAGQAGGGGLAGDGGTSTFTLGSATQPGTINTGGKYGNGVVVQSIGGGGGSGGTADGFNAAGGAGAPGGDAGAVTAALVNGQVVATGPSASALILQSIGGGGGIGGDATGIAIGASLAIGGNGGLGGDGYSVAATLGTDAIVGSTNPLGDGGVLAQSIGGSGGSGGSATSTGAAFLILTVGGDAAGGGGSRYVEVDSAALVTTYGDHAAGIMAQSIGGGGGKGGSATAFNVGVLPLASIAVGGRGGGGGPADPAFITSSGQVTTYGPDAYGLIAQSVGGGGGAGGAAAARTVALSPDKRIPAVSISVALGGKGGGGNTGDTAGVTNSSLVTTAGEGATAMVAQSIGGGGGVGGDSTAVAYSGGAQGGIKISVATAVGGSGGSGGFAGAANGGNSGLLLTLGTDAYGMLAQSVGGGGGAGGAGDATASSGLAKQGISVAITVGGTGGSGGTGGIVTAGNTGGIFTGGDGSDGVFAQSVGGGGGAGNGGVATANGTSLSVAVGVGGSGGAGGDGGAVAATSSGAIVTRGADAAAIFAQSVGGGGGKAGKGGATSGGVNPVNNAQSLFNNIAGGLNLGGSVTTPIDGIFKIAGIANASLQSALELQKIAGQLAGGPSPIGMTDNLDVSVSVGGTGGAAGIGGDIQATNTGQITTFGAQSDAVFAQSIGGGGGRGGASSATDKSPADGRNQAAVGVGGSGGAGGDGGTALASNAAGGVILTQGVLAFGLAAQSVGGGGGSAALSGTVSGSLKSLSVGIGGSGGAQGAGGAVTLDNAGAITTTGKHGVAMLAQSIGGGGGIVRTMTTDETFDPAKIDSNPQGRVADVHGLTLAFGGGGNPRGNGGEVQVDVAGAVTTGGRDAYAVFAQSIGGGGGAAFGGQVLGGNGGSTGVGDGGPVTVVTSDGTKINTTGDGGYGIIAQSIGGGGGLAGDLGSANFARSLSGNTVITAGTGTGGAVTLQLNQTALYTTGTSAPGIFAQSLGGGGGIVAQSGVLYSGGAGGGGTGGGVVEVALTSSTVSATGTNAPGIVVQTNGNNGSAAISLDSASTVIGGAAKYLGDSGLIGAIVILEGGDNTVVNAGTITGVAANNVAAIAIQADGMVSVTNSGTINGAVDTGTGSSIANLAGGVLDPRVRLQISGGTLTNAGTLIVGGAGVTGVTTLTGTLVQTPTGVIQIDVDAVAGNADLLTVTGAAQLDGTVQVNPISFRKGVSAPLIVAEGGITTPPTLVGLATVLFRQTPVLTATTLAVRTDADFKAGDPGLSGTQSSLAGYLQRVFDRADPGFDAGFASLAGVDGRASYLAALDAISGQAVISMAAIRYEASQSFARATYGCPTFADAGTLRTEHGCLWLRTAGVWTDRGRDGGFSGYKWNAGTLQIGGQREVGLDLHLGGSIGYERGRLHDRTGLTRIDSDAVLAAVSLTRQRGPWMLAGAVDVGVGWFDSYRHIPVASGGQAQARSIAFNGGLHLRAPYRLGGPGVYFEPALELDINYLKLDGYREHGFTPFNLRVQSSSEWVLSATPGVKFGTSIDTGGTAIDLYAGVGASFLHGNKLYTRAAFTSVSDGVGDFHIRLDDDSVIARYTAGFQMFTASYFDVRLQYEGRVSGNQTAHGGGARLTYRF